jgi:hypothetical protein
MPWNASGQAERRRQAIEDHPGRQHVTTRCGHCRPHGGRDRGPDSGRFTFTGTLRAGQAALAQHRLEQHPELPPLHEDAKTTRRKQRAELVGHHALNVADTPLRHLATPEELREREILRRLVRSDLPAIEKA